MTTHADLESLVKSAGLTEHALVGALACIAESPERGALSFADLDNLDRFGGIDAGLVERATNTRAERRAAEAVADAARESRGLTTTEVAALLGKDPSRISHLKSNGDLYSLPGRSRNVFPRWQFVVDPASGHERPLPHLGAVLAALPHPIHPATLERFVTVPQDPYLLDGTPVSAAHWLNSGGDISLVLSAAESMHVLG